MSVWTNESIHWANERNNYKYYKANPYNCICWINYEEEHTSTQYENKCHRAFAVRFVFAMWSYCDEHHSRFNASIIISVKLTFCCTDRCFFRSTEMQYCRRRHHHYHHEYNNVRFRSHRQDVLRFCFVRHTLLLLNSTKRKEISSHTDRCNLFYLLIMITLWCILTLCVNRMVFDVWSLIRSSSSVKFAWWNESPSSFNQSSRHTMPHATIVLHILVSFFALFVAVFVQKPWK